jgi:hypothetical protein
MARCRRHWKSVPKERKKYNKKVISKCLWRRYMMMSCWKCCRVLKVRVSEKNKTHNLGK